MKELLVTHLAVVQSLSGLHAASSVANCGTLREVRLKDGEMVLWQHEALTARLTFKSELEVPSGFRLFN